MTLSLVVVTLICLLLVLLLFLYVILPAYVALAPIVAAWWHEYSRDYVNSAPPTPTAQTADEPHQEAVRPSVRPPSAPASDLAALRLAVQSKNSLTIRVEVARLLVACGATTTQIREVIKGSNDNAGKLADAPPVANTPRLVNVNNGEYAIRLDVDEETRYQPL